MIPNTMSQITSNTLLELANAPTPQSMTMIGSSMYSLIVRILVNILIPKYSNRTIRITAKRIPAKQT